MYLVANVIETNGFDLANYWMCPLNYCVEFFVHGCGRVY